MSVWLLRGWVLGGGLLLRVGCWSGCDGVGVAVVNFLIFFSSSLFSLTYHITECHPGRMR